MTENKLKEILKEQRTEFQHVIGIFNKNVETQVQLIGEQYASIMNNIEIIKCDVQSIKSSLKKKVDYDEFDALVRRVSLLESKMKK
ncbi:MAG: hypothetical protein WC539_04395 [Nitrospirota bacterium]